MNRFRHLSLLVKLARRLAVVGALVGALLAPQRSMAQGLREIPRPFLDYVMPGADRFSETVGDPPVLRGFRARADGDGGGEVLIGYVFLTADWPPEEMGYSGPIEAVVGMDLEGWVTGIRVWDYWESHRNTRGDFLSLPGFQEQFAGKHIGEPFAVYRDVIGISRATITVHALSRGIRNAARRVANTYIAGPATSTEVVDDLTSLSWLEMTRLGVVKRFVVSDDVSSAEIFLVHIDNDEFGEMLVGPDALGMTTRRIAARGGGDHRMVYAVNGSYVRFFRGAGWSVAQDGDTIALALQDVFAFGGAGGGMMRQQAGVGGAMIIDKAIDIAKPFTMLFRLEPGSPLYSTEYVTQAARRAGRQTVIAEEAVRRSGGQAVATDERADEAVDGPPGGAGQGGGPPGRVVGGAGPPGEVQEGGGPPGVGGPGADTAVVDSVTVATVDMQQFDFGVVEEESALTATFAGTSWTRVFSILLLLGLATAAFFVKNTRIMWVTLTFTLVFLGFVDGGFLSVSHITSLIWVGPSAFLTDLPLLILGLFTVLTTLWFGRVLCGFLCPFGALQDFLTRFVPRRFRVRVPWRVNRWGLYAKYGVLAFVVVPALAGSHVSLYQYVEPFGTVFFWSSSILLWAIALVFLFASAVVPRFYCRYVCPLGAALAVVSVVALKRIRRVEHCYHCKVCEQKCPTGAIRGQNIDFKECVRCNICEIELSEQTGVCGHGIEDVRQRLVQLRSGKRERLADAS